MSVARPTLDAWEHQGVMPRPGTLQKVANILEYQPDVVVPPSELVRRLVALRKRLRLARSDVAEGLGVSYATVWSWETGERRPRGRTIALLHSLLKSLQAYQAGEH